MLTDHQRRHQKLSITSIVIIIFHITSFSLVGMMSRDDYLMGYQRYTRVLVHWCA